ncbi:MAG: polyphosphate kinase 2 family protein [Acidobacteria bacterium]|nr:polyphosphate kinase 2 family protein [Acidobacteriota bacterium]
MEPGAKVRLKDFDPDYHDNPYPDDPKLADTLAKDLKRMAVLQERLWAEHRRSLLIVLQAMDAGGKDGTIKHVMSGLNPQSCRVASFKKPAGMEAERDFLWRIHRVTPAQGEIVIFNRSHYEDVLIARVHKLVPKSVWKGRYEHINNFEKHLVDSGAEILKFFLHVSKDEQRQRFQERLDDPDKHWKLSEADFAERERWNDYQEAFEDALSECSTEWAPWYVIPANRKWFRNYAVAGAIVDKLEGMDPQFPPPQVDVSKLVLR